MTWTTTQSIGYSPGVGGRMKTGAASVAAFAGILFTTGCVATTNAANPALTRSQALGMSVELPKAWSLDPVSGGITIPGAKHSLRALLFPVARTGLEGFLHDVEPSIIADQMQRRSFTTERAGGVERTEIEWGRDASVVELTMTGAVTTSGSASIFVLCGSTPERRPSGDAVCAPILRTLRGPAPENEPLEPGRVSGAGWSVVLPDGWGVQLAREDGSRIFVSPQRGIAPVFLQVMTLRTLAKDEEAVRDVITRVLGTNEVTTTPTTLGALPGIAIRVRKMQKVEPAFALVRFIAKEGRTGAAMCISAAVSDRPACKALVNSLRFSE